MEQGQVLPAGAPGRQGLTPEEGRRRFARAIAGERASDPKTIAAMRGDHSLVPGGAPPASALTPAAVLVPLVLRPAELTVMLTQRTAHLAAHGGANSLPGSRAAPEASDCSRP